MPSLFSGRAVVLYETHILRYCVVSCVTQYTKNYYFQIVLSSMINRIIHTFTKHFLEGYYSRNRNYIETCANQNNVISITFEYLMIVKKKILTLLLHLKKYELL